VGLVGELLERAVRATPADDEDGTSGWWLRHSDGLLWWAGVALAHGPSDRLADRIVTAEQFFQAHGAVPRFQICGDCPAGLDAALAERGYRYECPMSVLTRRTAGNPPIYPAGMSGRIRTEPDNDWIGVLASTCPPDTDMDGETRRFAAVPGNQRFVTVYLDGAPAGVGRAVTDNGWTGVFTMATSPWARRRGVADAVLSAIGEWAAASGAPDVFLEVEKSNDVAHRVYLRAGFTHLADYHYRIGPVQTGR
jgi:GNAT superfamily N-acetyltransferase